MDSSIPFVHEVPHPDTGECLGWLAIDSVVQGLSFGGCRISADVTRSEVVELAAAMSWKLGAHESPVGGAKGGIRIDPESPDASRLIRHYGESLRAVLSEHVILGKDMGANDQRIRTLYEGAGVPQLAPLRTPGLNWLAELPGYRKYMTGLGISFAAQAAYGRNRLDGVRVAIQGAGVVGLGAAVRLAGLGASIHAMSDVNQSLYWPSGVEIDALISGCSQTRDLSALKGKSSRARDEVFGAEVDLLILAAASYSVNPESLSSIRATHVIEGANMAFTSEGRRAADQSDRVIIPDVIASSSSAAMVCLQMANRGGLDEETLWKRIEFGINHAISSGMELAKHHKISLRDAHIMRINEALIQDKKP